MIDLQVELSRVRWDNSKLRKRVHNLNSQNKLLADQVEFYRKRVDEQERRIKELLNEVQYEQSN